ncbi:MAG: DUF5522 domain-containing protein [Terriglobia bacterium]|jgi:hypothetical protein|nr:DUF5522 domain-containing protein [Terriglobia bacterium]
MSDLLVEGIDFYYENGLMVFTAEYLKKRGYCCRSGCRHCPYGFKPEQDVKIKEDVKDTRRTDPRR